MSFPQLARKDSRDTDTIGIKAAFRTVQLAARFAGHLHECGIEAIVRDFEITATVELLVKASQLDHVNFAYYLVEEWTRG